MPTKPQSLLTIEHLSAEIGGRVVLHDINLDLDRSEWLAVAGGSGDGKSTLLRAMMGLKRPARPTGGTISFNGARWSCTNRGSARPRRMAFVPQSPAHGFDPLRRLRWQGAQLSRRIGGEQADRQALFDTLGLPDPGSRHPHEWSRGCSDACLSPWH